MTTQVAYAVPEARSGETFGVGTEGMSPGCDADRIALGNLRSRPSRIAVSMGVSLTALAVVLFAIMFAGAPAAEAVTYTTTNGSSPYNWSDTTRWSPTGFPSTGDTA